MRAHPPLASEQDVDQEVGLEEVMTELAGGQGDQLADQADDQASLPHEVMRYQGVVTAMQRILDGQAVEVEALAALSDAERAALEALVTVVRGFTEQGRYVYAEDRLEDLNSVLAVLQPVLSVGTVPGVELLRASFDQVVDQLDDLRQQLDQLDGAQEELDRRAAEAALAAGEGDQDDDEDEQDAPEWTTPPSTLSEGPAVQRVVGSSTLLDEPDAPGAVEPAPAAAPPVGTKQR